METSTKSRPRRRWGSSVSALAWYISLMALAAFATLIGYGTALEVRHLARPVPPTPDEVAQDLVVRNVADASGNRATFRILLLTDEYRWRLSSAEALEGPTGRLEFSPEMKAVLDDAREIICIGASSEEMAGGASGEGGRRAEERRAGRRAERIAQWVSAAIARPIPIRKLNAGLHASTGATGDTSDQRRVVIVLVLERDEQADIDQTLRQAMERERARAPIFDTLLTKYSLSSGATFSWIE